MRDGFEIAGVVLMASTKRSLRIELKDCPFTCPYYVSIKDVEAVLKGKKQTATIVMLTKQNKIKQHENVLR